MKELEIINSERIKPLIDSGIAKLINEKYCMKFNEYLCKEYPWVKYSDRIDWDQVESCYKRLRWKETSIAETTEFLKSTCIKQFSEICIVYSASRPGLVVDFDYACRELEKLTIFGWATRFLVGTKKNQYGLVELIHNCFVEIDSVHWLTAPF